LARAIRADVRLALAENLDDVEEAQRAANDIQAAKEFLPENPYVLSVSAFVHLDIANFYRKRNDSRQEQAAIRVAASDVRALEKSATLPYPAYALWYYFGVIGREPEQFQFAQLAAEGDRSPVVKTRYAIALCRRGQFEEALRVLDERKSNEIDGDRLRTYVLAELHPGDIDIARKSNEEIKRRYLPEMAMESLYSEMESYRRTLFLLGQTGDAIASYRLAKGRLEQSFADWEKPFFDFATRNIAEDELFDKSDEKWISFYKHYVVALFRLSEGNRLEARKHFQRAIKEVFFPTFEWDLVQTYLIRMEQDPNWPPWIPH
jgi:pentatricopeptide repeat protein